MSHCPYLWMGISYSRRRLRVSERLKDVLHIFGIVVIGLALVPWLFRLFKWWGVYMDWVIGP